MAIAEYTLDAPRARTGHGALLLVAAVFAGLAARILGYELRVDEQLYIAPAALLGEGGLYTDFFYNHVPMSAFYFRLIHLGLGEDNLVLAARLGIVLAWAVTLALVWLASLKIAQSVRVALFCVLALEANVYLLTVPGMTATNNFLQLGPVYAGMALFALAVLDRRRNGWKAFGAGLALSLAAGLKVGAAVVIPPLALAALVLPWRMDFWTRLRSITLPMAAGGVIGALPLFAYLIAYPQVFLAHIVGYHTGPHVAYWTAMRHTEPTLAFDPAGKARLAFEIWLQSTNLLILLAVLVLGTWALAQRSRGGARHLGLLIALTAAIAAAAALSFVPTPAFPQYFILPLAGVVLLPAVLWRSLPAEVKPQARTFLSATILVIVLLAMPRLAEPVAKLALGAPTTPQRVQSAASQIRDAVGQTPGRIATLRPVYALQAGLPVYRELATGPFAYRVVPFVAPETMEPYVTTGPDQLAALLDGDPPAAVLTGFDARLEAPFVDWARTNGYTPDASVTFKDRYGTAVLWLPPGAGVRP